MLSSAANPGSERAARTPILDKIEQALRDRAERLGPANAEDVLVAAVPPPMIEDARPQPIKECLGRAERQAHAAETLIEEAATTLTGWRERAAALRRRLAECPPRAL